LAERVRWDVKCCRSGLTQAVGTGTKKLHNAQDTRGKQGTEPNSHPLNAVSLPITEEK
jgi:hypothetical protein